MTVYSLPTEFSCPHNRCHFNTLRLGPDGRDFADYIFTYIFLNEKVWITIEISLTLVSKGPIDNNLALVQIMAWGRPGERPLSESVMVSLLTHICHSDSINWTQNTNLHMNAFSTIVQHRFSWLYIKHDAYCSIRNKQMRTCKRICTYQGKVKRHPVVFCIHIVFYELINWQNYSWTNSKNEFDMVTGMHWKYYPYCNILYIEFLI